MMTVIEDITTKPFCVYAHYTDDVLVYIGSGRLSRALDMRDRKPDHLSHLSSGRTKVLIMSRFSKISEARKAEQIAIERCLPKFNYMHTRQQHHVDKSAKRDMRPILCEQTNERFYSAAHISGVTGCSVYDVHRHLHGKLPSISGNTYKRVDWAELGADPSERWLYDNEIANTSRGDTLSYAKSRAVLDVILDSIAASDEAPANREIAHACNITPESVMITLKKLIDSGYIEVEKTGPRTRVFYPTNMSYKRSTSFKQERLSGFSASTRKIFEVLKHATENNLPCPTTSELALASGLTEASAGQTVGRLKRAGYLTVNMIGQNRRCITIEGKTTMPTRQH